MQMCLARALAIQKLFVLIFIVSVLQTGNSGKAGGKSGRAGGSLKLL